MPIPEDGYGHATHQNTRDMALVENCANSCEGRCVVVSAWSESNKIEMKRPGKARDPIARSRHVLLAIVAVVVAVG